MQHGYGDEPGYANGVQHGRHDRASDTAPSDNGSQTGTAGSDIMFRDHVRARSAVLDTLGQAHDGPAAGG
ncbi:MAG TPA: hypothetical protein VH327_05360, partial [Gammaproteobacteria bacterium]|nr:hypothetical protein [Gammaproteobacteria bacterium]